MKSFSSERIGVRQYNKSELPRLRWTPELHRYFVQTVEILGGRNQATPKRILQMMGVKGLKISHIKSHLQMYRSMKLERGSDCEQVVMRQAMKQPRRRTSHSCDIRVLFSSVSSSNGRLREQDEEFNGSNRKHESPSNVEDRIISRQDSDSCLVGRMSDEECHDIGGSLSDQTCDCELSLSLKPSPSPSPPPPMRQILERELWPHQFPNNSYNSTFTTTTSHLNFVLLKEFPPPLTLPLPPSHHHINLDLTI